MGIMSKSNRLPERPKPPSWAEITVDVTNAQVNDVVFIMGHEYFTASTVTWPRSAQDNSHHPSEVESSSPETCLTDPDSVKNSKTKALKLIDSYTQLTDSLSALQDQYENLKQMRLELSHSVSELQIIARDMQTQDTSPDTHSKTNSSVTDQSSSTGKPKKKKKK